MASQQEQKHAAFLKELETQNGKAGNKALRDALGWDEPTYDAVKDELLDNGDIEKGGGRGGSVRLVGYVSETEQALDELLGDFELTAPEQKEAASKPKAKRKKARAGGKTGEPAQVVSYRHKETRVNNPEVGMVHAGTDPDQPKTEWQYDPHLDPVLNFDSARASIETLIDEALESGDPERMKDALTELKRLQAPYLNWTGKAERTSFEIDTVSLHVHERVDPATILANARKRLKEGDSAEVFQQADLFAAPFENLPLRQALDFYSHEKGWSNRLVAGDSLLVMNSLLTKESMGGKVQMIYIDPPYGIKYGSNFQPFTSKREVKDRSDADLTQEPEMIKAFRDTWELGIHSYLTYLRDRLVLARELLTETGSVFVQISDDNVHHIRELADEVFGVENFLSIIAFTKAAGGLQAGNRIGAITDYIVWYARDAKKVKYRRLYQKKQDAISDGYTLIGLPGGYYESSKAYSKRSREIPGAKHHMSVLMTKPGPGSRFAVEFCGTNYTAGGRWWGTTPEGIERVKKSMRGIPTGSSIRLANCFEDFPYGGFQNLWAGLGGAANPVYVVQTNETVSERCLLMTTDPGDLVLDPTCGSGTTAFVAEKWGRRWITCDTSRIAITLAKQRLVASSFDYYALRYPHEGLKGGFDYETVPHVTLKSIANNPDIDTIYEEDHPKIEAALNALNKTLTAEPPKPLKAAQGVRNGQEVDFAKGEVCHEWEVPFDWPDNWPETAKKPFETFHKARQVMQKRMDQSIADHADQETLYDKPKIDKKRLRITGPFSVEAVPAPTVLSLDDSLPPSEADDSIARSGETSRQAMWRDELLKTGVRAKGGAMLRFAEFETVPGLKHIHASGSIAKTGERVVVSFGPEHVALEQRQVELALTEVESLRPAPKYVLFCAFTFDPEAAKDIDEVTWPGVTLLKAQMNTDLLTEDLKKKRSSNQSFWLMGQPEIDVRRQEDGLWVVEVYGFDYFNPKTGELDSGGPKNIAMWSLDTDYDERSLMPHQVFFPMADAKGGWHRLKKTIRSELDEDLLDQFHGTVSLPFEAGDNRKVAVKIVDDRGIESLKIMPLGD